MKVPSGGIIIWSGSLVTIPNKFVLCDGNNGTPDLRDKFVIGAEGAYAVDASGGNTTHTHDFTGSGHNHALASGEGVAAGINLSASTGSQSGTGTTNPGSSLPPYYALCYIMKT